MVGLIVVCAQSGIGAEAIDLGAGGFHDDIDVVDGRATFTVLGGDAATVLQFLSSAYQVDLVFRVEAKITRLPALAVTDGDFAQAAEKPLRALGMIARPGPGGVLHPQPRTSPDEPSVILPEPRPQSRGQSRRRSRWSPSSQ